MLASKSAFCATLAVLAISATSASASVVLSGPVASGGLAASPPPQSFNAGDNVSFTSFISAGEGTVDFTFTANQATNIVGFSVTGVGLLADFPLVTFDLDNGVGGDSTFSVTPGGPAVGFGGGFKDNFTMTAGETVTLTFTETSTLTSALQIGAFFETTPAAIPLPAGVLLLGTALGGLSVARSRKAKADA